MTRFIFAAAYEQSLREIEDFIFESTQRVESVEQFLDDHDGVLSFIERNPATAAVHPSTE